MMFRMNKIKSIIINTTSINSVKRYLSQSKINDNTVKEATNLFIKVKTIFTMKVVGGLTAAFIVSLPIVAYGFDYCDQWNINETLLEGQNIETSTDYYERKDITGLLSSKISPSNKDEANYYIISGVKCVGKTTSVIHFTKSRYNNKDVNNKGGVIYVSCDDVNDFGKAFADAISYSTIYEPSLFRLFYVSRFSILPSVDATDSKKTFDACRKKFYHAVKNYKKITGNTPILIIDNVNNFLINETAKSFLQELQGYAKEDADKDLLRFVFVTSEGGGLEFLERRSQEPREDFIVLSDMTDKEAFKYIETACKDKLKKYDVNEVKQMIQDISGGRISVLAKMAIEINSGRSLEELKQQLLNSAGKSVQKAGMATPSNKVYEPFWKVAKLLLACKGENKMVEDDIVIKLINNDDITLSLRNSNVFSYNQATNEIGFQSRAIQYYLQQQLSKMNEENEFKK